MLNTGIDEIYIVHAVLGYELHEQHTRKLFAKLGLDNYEFVTEGDLSCLTQAMLDKYFCSNIKEVLRPGVMSCTLNHILSYERIVARGNKYALVFENDPFLLGNFIKKIKRVVNEANTLKPGFIISLENTTLRFPSFTKTKKGKYLYKASYGRAAGAYLIDLTGAQKILEDLKTNKCCQVIDWWHNTLIKRGVVDMYWAHPPLTEQGSHNGMMHSIISSKNSSVVRRVQWITQKFYRTHIRQIFKNDAY
jgi:glycosyl transferase family 25